jgi:putative copper export protein
MNQFIAIVNHWLHLMSAVIWIGGLAFLVMSVTPALRNAVPKEYLKPVIDAVSNRYRKIVGILMAVILMTGGINLHFISQMMLSQTGSGISNNPKYLTILFIKLTLVLGIVTLFLYTFIFKSEPVTDDTEEELEAVPFQRVAFWMGILIILCAAALKFLHF